jgi:hypothetical protein
MYIHERKVTISYTAEHEKASHRHAITFLALFMLYYLIDYVSDLFIC